MDSKKEDNYERTIFKYQPSAEEICIEFNSLTNHVAESF
jgi:hypothetical protein